MQRRGELKDLSMDILGQYFDKRENDDSLNDEYRQKVFVCQENCHSKENKFKFIRYMQEDSWSDSHPYCIWIEYFELYGEIFDI